MIACTYPEPWCDVLAQTRALANPHHPKRTMWLSRSTQMPPQEASLILPEGCFWGTREDCARLRQAPSEETLATLLGYVEPKSAISGPWALVQARDGDECVVGEQMCSLARLPEAIAGFALWGTIRILNAEQVLLRRATLKQSEISHVAL